MRKALCAGLLAACSGFAAPAFADTKNDGWDVTLVPYVWTASVDGTVAHPALSTPISAQANFGDVLERLDIGGMVALEARKGRVGIIAEVLHISMSDTASMPLLGLPVGLSTRTTGGFLAGEVRVVDTDALSIDTIAGLRYWSVSTRVRYAIPGAIPLPPGIPLPRAYDGRKGADWVDAMSGLKASASFGSGIHATATGMIGFGGSDFVTDFSALVGIDVSRRTNLVVGYRHLDIDYSKRGFTFNARIHGPLIGMGVRF